MSDRAVLTVYEKPLPVPLTAEERAAWLLLYAQIREEIEALEKAEQARRKDFKERIGELETEARSLRRVAVSGSEKRQVACEDVADFRRGVVETYRNDTGAIVAVRDLEELERQMEFAT
jgi:hypothetical protein